MDSNSIVEKLGQLLMSPENDLIQGKNKSLYAKPLDKIFNPYRRNWMRKHIEEFVSNNQKKPGFPFQQYCDILRRMAKDYSTIFLIYNDCEDKVNATVSLFPVGFVSFENPNIEVSIKKTVNGHGVLNILFDGTSLDFVQSPDDFHKSMEKLCTLPVQADMEVIKEHYQEFLPSNIKHLYSSVTITEDLGRSRWGDGSFFYGHEVKLKMPYLHDFIYGYVTEYLGGDKNMIETTAKCAYDMLVDLSRLLPGLSVVSEHADDCGICLTRSLPSNIGVLMNRINRWDSGHVTEETVSKVLKHLGVEYNKSMVSDIYHLWRQESITHDERFREVIDNLPVGKNGWSLVRTWDEMRLYVSGKRCWDREVYVGIPYDCPEDVYKKIVEASRLLKTFSKMMKSRRDCITSVGIFSK